jgi:hypothetical protein
MFWTGFFVGFRPVRRSRSGSREHNTSLQATPPDILLVRSLINMPF